LAAGILFGSTVLVLWICGGFESVPRQRVERQHLAGWLVRSSVDPLPEEEFIPDEPGEVTPQRALDYMLTGKFGRFGLPGVVLPTAVPAASATTGDDAQIVGVGVDGRWRAYCISEMQTPMTHVINDVLGKVPVTVTFCDANNCARVLTNRDESNRPLDVGVGGFWHDGMLLQVEDQNFSQASHEIPLQDLKFEMTTWKEWKQAHPQTDICPKLEPSVLVKMP
jgi:hypothetical protein